MNVTVSYAIKSNIWRLLWFCFESNENSWQLVVMSTKSGQGKKEHTLSPPDVLSFIQPTDSLSVLCLLLVLTERMGSTQGDVADGRL